MSYLMWRTIAYVGEFFYIIRNWAFYVILPYIQPLLIASQGALVAIRASDSETINLLNAIKDGLVIYLQAYNTVFTLRFVLMWFPTINPFIQPYYIVRVVTEPFIGWIRKHILRDKTLFGMDFSFLLSSYAISLSIEYLMKFKF